ncbi:MAG: thrombospondin type 3 repeat-containing protein, partial [Gammaproteobacteria bacterium]|nr:thrombospondin type 3 repeat-containing protein [Gammaproteobacteria bacterium]
MHLSATHYLRLAALFVFSLLIAACSGGGSYDGGTTTSSTPLTGGGVKGPMAGAVVQVYEIDFNGGTITRGRLAAEGSTNAQAQIVGLGFPFPTVFPYLVEFTSDADTIDLTTGQAPVISTLTTVVTAQLAAKGEQVYATPLTNMAVDIAFQNFDDFDGTTSSNNDDLKAALDAAAAQVASTVGFGLDANQIDIFDTPPLVDETVAIGSGEGDTPVADVSAYRAAVEALTAVVAQINEQSTDDNSDPGAVLANLAKDLAGDGVIDGDDGSGNVVVEPTALDVLDQDPNTLPIPNTCADADKDANGVCNDGATPLTVDQVEEIVAAETADTGNEVSEQEQQEIANQETATQPAARNPDRDKDGVDNALDDFPDDPSADRDTDGDGQPDVAYLINQDGSRGEVLAGCDSIDSKSESQPEEAQPMRLAKPNFRCSDDDDDADGVFDTVEAQDGTDPLDPDTDDDTISDGDEKALGSNPLFADSDEDGVNDPDDNCPVDENADQLDFDEDGVGAACDEDDRVAVPDADGDGVPDDSDNCPNDFNPAQTNTDSGFQSGDPAGDVCDDDDDGDGVNDADDEFPLNNSESADNDKDGIGDNADRDDDNDGLDDLEDDAPNDRDADDDGVLDGADEFPSDPNESRDTDGDQIGDNADTDDDNDNVLDDDEAAQGTNPRVADTDRDGTNDGNDNCPVDANEDQTNSDDDELGDACDNDDDNDTVEDGVDNCPVDANTDQANSDDDALGNACDDDDDNDTVADEADNCPVDANTDQLNSDGDDEGNVCDDDDDNDDVADANDACPTTPQDLVGQVDSEGCAPGETDTDGDGVFDNVDNCPAIQNADQTDTDGDEAGNVCDDDDDNDNVSDSDEATNGTDPLLADTDSDDTNDDTDNCPLTANEDQTDTDQDGDGNACDDDDDNDNVSDTDEATNGTDPLLADTDSDDVNDDTDNCPVDANNDQANQDNDDFGDVCDDDRDGDGTNNEQDEFPDDAGESADADGDTIGDNADQCDSTPTGEEIDDPGCSASERDTDGDGVNDNVDACPGTPAGSTLVENGCTQEQLEQTALGVFNSAGFDINVRGPTDADAAIEEIQLDAGLFRGVLTLSISD